MLVRVVLALTGAGLRRHSGYRGAMAAAALTNTVFAFLRGSIVVAAVAAAGGSIAGYGAATAVTYAWVTQALIAPVEVFQWSDLAERVRTGDVAVDLARPVDLQLQFAAADAGRAVAVLLPRSVPLLAVGALTVGLTLPAAPAPYLLGLVALVLGVAISFACRFLLNLAAFWLVEIRGPVTVYVTVSTLLAGLFVPVHWFPDGLRTLAYSTPFPSMVQAPADVLTGRVQGTAALGVLAVQLAWAVAMVLAGRVVLARATRRLVVQGG